MAINENDDTKAGIENGQVTEVPDAHENDLAHLSDHERLELIRKNAAVEDPQDGGIENGQVTELPDVTEGTAKASIEPPADLAKDTPPINPSESITSNWPAPEAGPLEVPKSQMRDLDELLTQYNNPANHPGVWNLRKLAEESDLPDDIKIQMNVVLDFAVQAAKSPQYNTYPRAEGDPEELGQGAEELDPGAPAQDGQVVLNGDHLQHLIDQQNGDAPSPPPIEELGELPSVGLAIETLVQAMRTDPEYLWGWVANLAMASVDQGLEHLAANRAAATFLYNLSLNTHGEPLQVTEHPHYKALVQRYQADRKAAQQPVLPELQDELSFQGARKAGFVVSEEEYDKVARSYGQSGWLTAEQAVKHFSQNLQKN